MNDSCDNGYFNLHNIASNQSDFIVIKTGQSVQRDSALISDYINNNNPYTDHIAETFVLLLLCILLLLYKIMDIFRKVLKCRKQPVANEDSGYYSDVNMSDIVPKEQIANAADERRADVNRGRNSSQWV